MRYINLHFTYLNTYLQEADGEDYFGDPSLHRF